MSENISRQAETRQICNMIRSETIRPWSWAFAAANPCISCFLLTGGRPEIMSCYCPRVNAYLAKRLEREQQNQQAKE
jgi:hypothetical protein